MPRHSTWVGLATPPHMGWISQHTESWYQNQSLEENAPVSWHFSTRKAGLKNVQGIFKATRGWAVEGVHSLSSGNWWTQLGSVE